ncbi:Zn-ribbon domain-containing OB-fold protein [Streptomyces sp. NBC_00564]|uniref:Zn-ribbon domain-containing OB-fold protein n=1 Tax=unclassified Streptomyces TaxID=2593676 RepID=UPI002FCD8D01|nr:Zn-ribbon domain-containing OB-fold protein [Streptomyces sp. NBC_00564]WUC47138.1 Zn-ribbon domain-containing OB-fold protein [Streptomyces sp. NBC_00554]
MSRVPGLPLPDAQFESLAFWTGGERGELLIHRCGECGLWLHPPKPVCRRCMSRAVTPQPVSGEGTVYSYTVNRQQWMPDMEVPYVLAVVELAEDPGLRLTTRLTGVDPSDVRIGLPVRVVFEQVEEIWLPLFTPHSKTSEEEAR